MPPRQEKLGLFACSRKLPQYNYTVNNNLYVSHVLTKGTPLLFSPPLTHLFQRSCFHHKSLSGFYFLLINEVAKEDAGVGPIQDKWTELILWIKISTFISMGCSRISPMFCVFLCCDLYLFWSSKFTNLFCLLWCNIDARICMVLQRENT